MKLAAIFTDHMVLQRDFPIAIFGEGNGNGTATLNGAVIEFEADGKFVAYLPAMKAGGPYELIVTMGDESVTFTDVLIGDVYLAGGQSNMQFRVEESTDIPRIGNPMVRHFTEGHFADENRVENYNYTPWQVATEENLEKFSAIGYDVGRMLCEKMDIPSVSSPATSVHPVWMPGPHPKSWRRRNISSCWATSTGIGTTTSLTKALGAI